MYPCCADKVLPFVQDKLKSTKSTTTVLLRFFNAKNILTVLMILFFGNSVDSEKELCNAQNSMVNTCIFC
jgi:hypothetical protein